MALSDKLNPRKLVSGTSYKAKPADPELTPDYGELGSSAINPIREVVPQLATQNQRVQMWERMTNNDVAVDVSLRAAKVPILGADFFLEPYSDDPLDLDASEFISDNLFKGQSAPFLQVQEDVLRMFEHGNSMLEPVYELREWSPRRARSNRKQYTMLRKLAPRPATTIKKIVYDDNGGPVEVLQGAIRADGKTEDVTIPISKLIIFTLGKKGGNLEGKSLLRTAYQPWYYKNHLYKIDAIQKERHGIGVPKARMQAGFTEKDKEAAMTLVRNLRSNEEAGMVLPPTMDVEFAELKNNPVDALESAIHHNGMIMLNVMAQFLLLGVEAGSGGGRATAAAGADMFMKSLRYVADLICQYYNMYLIPNLIVYNFPTVNFPQMKVRRLGEARDLQVWASGISALIDKGAITVDLDTEQWVREQVDMPKLLGDRPQTLSSEQNIIDILEQLGVQTDSRGRTPKSGSNGNEPVGPSGPGNEDPKKSVIGTKGNVPGGTGRIGAHPRQA